MGDFESTLTETADIEGWLRDEQARVLWTVASEAGSGAHIVEIGSYRGRSTVVLARAMPDDARLTAIDPHAGNDRAPQRWEGEAAEGEADNRNFWSNLRRAGVHERVEHIRARSDEAVRSVTGPVDVLYIDGAHRYRSVLSDLDLWASRLQTGGTVLIHDAYNSVGVTLALMRRMLFTSTFRYVGRCRSLAEYRCESVTRMTRLRNVLRQLRPLPWFARNVAIKILRAGGLGRAARVLGYRGDGTY